VRDLFKKKKSSLKNQLGGSAWAVFYWAVPSIRGGRPLGANSDWRGGALNSTALDPLFPEAEEGRCREGRCRLIGFWALSGLCAAGGQSSFIFPLGLPFQRPRRL